MRAETSLLICILSFCCAFICLLPLYYRPAGSEANEVGEVDDYIFNFEKDPSFRQATLSCLIITIPSFLDLTLDLIPSTINNWLVAEDRHLRSERLSMRNAFHMNLIEKGLFVIGVAGLAAISIHPWSTDFPPTALFICFSNFNTVLTICPILSFLTRCAPSWNPIVTLFMASLVGAAGILSSYTFTLPADNPRMSTLLYAANISFNVSSSVYVLMCLLSLFNTFVRKVRYEDDERNHLQSSDTNNSRVQRSISESRLRDLVIAAHVLATLAQFVVNSVWLWYVNALDNFRLQILIYTVMSAAAVVFVTEFRMRKRQLTNALVRIYLPIRQSEVSNFKIYYYITVPLIFTVRASGI
jgi:hypothetical protein